LKNKNDAFGVAIYDWYLGDNSEELASKGCRTWFSEYDNWFEREKKAIKLVKGEVLDIGCAAGRHSLYLQNKGHKVMAVDNSPLFDTFEMGEQFFNYANAALYDTYETIPLNLQVQTQFRFLFAVLLNRGF